jgi:Uncharacterized protein SCO1/SenC/PrrC, involved in biogenesis of respiratory and photosynthetic systems
MHMSNIGSALKKLPADVADRVKLVFVTTDPARDTGAGAATMARSLRQALRRPDGN